MAADFSATAERWLTTRSASQLRETISAARVLQLQAHEPPWRASGLRVKAGQAYSLFARIAPGGRAVNPTGDTGSFVADVDGELELGISMGVWKNATGDLATS